MLPCRLARCLRSLFLKHPCTLEQHSLHRHAAFSSLASKPTLRLEEAREANWKERVNLAAAFRGLEMQGFNEGICNHLSMMAPASDGQGQVMLMVPHGLHWKEVTGSSLIGVNEKCEVVEGKGEAEISAATIHAGVHKARPDVACAFHLHPPYATALGVLKDQMFGMYHQNSIRFYQEFTYDRDYSGPSYDEDEGLRTGKQLSNKLVLFMCNHGVLVVGKTVAQTFDDFYYLERSCMVQGLAMSMGREMAEIPDDICKQFKEELDKNKEKYANAHFQAIKRVVAETKPDYMT